MAKQDSVFVCRHCGYKSQKWLGRCPGCGQWHRFKEINLPPPTSNEQRRLAPVGSKPLKLTQISLKTSQRISTGLGEVNRILGGGLIPGQVLLVAGEPGIGKSTLLLQLIHHLGKTKKVLYISGEESLGQIKSRAQRLGIKNPSLFLSNETQVEALCQQAKEVQAGFVVVDSIQTLTSSTAPGGVGSISQVKQATAQLIGLAKRQQIPVIIVGQVTKEGVVAGPKALEHMVDTVLELTGERFGPLRLLRATKNRFGPIDELAVFEMKDQGLVEVKNPSALFCQEPTLGTPGSCLTVVMEGSRPILVEIQALVVTSPLPVPRRVGAGLDHQRVALLAAILQKRAGISVFNQDIYLKVSGGLLVKEPAADLAAALAVASSCQNKPLGKVVAIGEVGLLGEIRKVARMETRLKEAERLGFKTIISAENHKNLREVLKKLT